MHDSTSSVPGLDDGPCQIEWWNTWTGKGTRREIRQAQNAALTLPVEPLPCDTAARITARKK